MYAFDSVDQLILAHRQRQYRYIHHANSILFYLVDGDGERVFALESFASFGVRRKKKGREVWGLFPREKLPPWVSPRRLYLFAFWAGDEAAWLLSWGSLLLGIWFATCPISLLEMATPGLKGHEFLWHCIPVWVRDERPFVHSYRSVLGCNVTYIKLVDIFNVLGIWFVIPLVSLSKVAKPRA